MIRRIASLFLLMWVFGCQPKDPLPFQDGLNDYPTLSKVLGDPEKYKVQVLFTRIDRNEHGKPIFTDFSLHVDDTQYFYPASTVKLPIAALALEWLEEQNREGLTLETIMLTDSVRSSQVSALVDPSSPSGLPSIGHYIKKILLVSDNDASNRLYELMGVDYINRKLREKGLDHTIIMQRLSFPASPEENRNFNPIRFVDKSGKTILELPERQSDSVYVVPGNPKIGKAHYQKGTLVEEPMDFSFKNKFALSDLHGVVQRLIFPESFLESERFTINEEHRAFILKYMSMFPAESDYPSYDPVEYYDGFSKFFKFGTSKESIPDRFRIFNKTGWSYGHMIDGSYFVDFENGVEFFVSAVGYFNDNQTLNDDTYETDSIGLPFFTELGEYLYQMELKRKKQIPADLKDFEMDWKK